MRRAISALFLAGLTAGGLLHAGVERVRLELGPAAWPACAPALERALGALPWIASVERAADAAALDVVPRTAAPIDALAVAAAASAAGCTLVRIGATVRGRVVAEGRRAVLLAAGSGERFALLVARDGAIAPPTAAELAAMATPAGAVRSDEGTVTLEGALRLRGHRAVELVVPAPVAAARGSR